MSHGGNRSGAGRKKGGVSETRRRLSKAIEIGTANAVRQKAPELTQGKTDEEAAEIGAAMIVSDMIQAGQGAEVLKIWASIAPKTDEGGEGANDLSKAFSALPAHLKGTGQAEDTDTTTTTPAISTTYEEGAHHSELGAPENAPYFLPQMPLLVPQSEQASLVEPAPTATPLPPLEPDGCSLDG